MLKVSACHGGTGAMRGILLIVVIAALIAGPGVLVVLGPVWIVALIIVAVGWIIASLPDKK